MNRAAAAPATTATPEVVGFRPMRAPSLPFVIALLAAAAVALIILAAWSALITIAFALAAALLTMPIVNWLERHHVRRSVGALIVVMGLLLAFAVLALICVGIVLDQGASFVRAVPQALDTLRADYESMVLPVWLRSGLDYALNAVGQAIASFDPTQLALGFAQGVLGVAGLIAGLSVVPFFMYYVLVDQPQAESRFYRGLPAPWRVHADKVVEIFVRDFADYFRAELMVGGIVGVAVTLGLLVIGGFLGGPLAEFALLLGLLAAVMELMPSVGPVISFIPALLLAATTSPTAVVIVSVYYFVLFNIESSFLVPAIEGKVVDFDRATVLVLVALGFGLAGIAGGVLALPVAAIARDLFAYIFRTAQAESAVVAGS